MGIAIIAAALFNSAYSFAWDVKMDWGLAQPGSRKWGLRNTLLINHEDPWPYYAAVSVDLLLRLTWVVRLVEGRFRYTDMVLTLELVEVSNSGSPALTRLLTTDAMFATTVVVMVGFSVVLLRFRGFSKRNRGYDMYRGAKACA